MGKNKRGISTGTILAITFALVVAVGYAAIYSRLNTSADITANFAQMAVSFDSSFREVLSESAVRIKENQQPQPAKSTAVPAATAAPTATPQPKKQLTLCAGGSICADSELCAAFAEDGVYHFDEMFSEMNGLMKSDLSIATLEHTVIGSEKVSNTNVPAALLQAMANAGINAVSSGYPGIMSSGLNGLIETKKAVTETGMRSYGIYDSVNAHDHLEMQSINGIRVALLSFQSEIASAGKKAISKDKCDYAIDMADQQVMISRIQNARDQGAEIVVVSLSWGKADAKSPTDAQRTLAQQLADAGADLIIGTHSGIVQNVEILTAKRGDSKYHPVLCAYSLGNLISANREKGEYLAGLLLHAQIEYDAETKCCSFVAYSYSPTYFWREKQQGQYRYRLVPAYESVDYAFMSDKQKEVMQRWLKSIRSVMADSPIPAYR